MEAVSKTPQSTNERKPRNQFRWVLCEYDILKTYERSFVTFEREEVVKIDFVVEEFCLEIYFGMGKLDLSPITELVIYPSVWRNSTAFLKCNQEIELRIKTRVTKQKVKSVNYW